MQLNGETLPRALVFQRNEITEYHIYSRIAKRTSDSHNREVLERIANEELQHYSIW